MDRLNNFKKKHKQGKFDIPSQYSSDVTYVENIKSLAVTLYVERVKTNDRLYAF